MKCIGVDYELIWLIAGTLSEASSPGESGVCVCTWLHFSSKCTCCIFAWNHYVSHSCSAASKTVKACFLTIAVYIPTYSPPTELIIYPPVSFSIILVYQMPHLVLFASQYPMSAKCTGSPLTLLFPISFISCHAYLANGQVHVYLCNYLIVLCICPQLKCSMQAKIVPVC